MGQSKSDNIRVNAPKDIDDRSGVWENGIWRPYHTVEEFGIKWPNIVQFETQTFWVRSTSNSNNADLYALRKDKTPYKVLPDVDFSNYFNKEEVKEIVNELRSDSFPDYIMGSEFDANDLTKYSNADLLGYQLKISYSGFKWLIEGEDYILLPEGGFQITIPDFQASSTDLFVVFKKNVGDNPPIPKTNVPSNFFAKLQNGNVFLSWILSGNDSVVIQKLNGTGIFTTIYSGAEEEFEDSNLIEDPQTYRIKGVRNGYLDSNWVGLAISTEGLIYLNATPKADFSGIDLTLLAEDFVHKIQRSTDLANWVTLDTLSIGDKEFTDTTISKGVVYHYRAIKVDEGVDALISNNVKTGVFVGQKWDKSIMSYIEFPFNTTKHGKLNFASGGFSVSFRLKTGQFKTDVGGSVRLITVVSSTNVNHVFTISYDLTGQKLFLIAQTGTSTRLNVETININLNANYQRFSRVIYDESDVHIMLSFGGKSFANFKLYIDGMLATNVAAVRDTLVTDLTLNNTDKIYIGGHPTFAAVAPHNWMIYEFLLLGDVLTDSLAKSIFNKGVPKQSYSTDLAPLQWFDFKDDDGVTVYDKSANPINGTKVGTITKVLSPLKGISFTNYESAPLGVFHIINMKKTAPIGSFDNPTERNIAPLVSMGIGTNYSVNTAENIYLSANFGPFMGNNFEGITFFYDKKNQVLSPIYRTYSFLPASRDGHETLRINSIGGDIMAIKEDTHNGPIDVSRTYGDLNNFEYLSKVRGDSVNNNGLAYPQVFKVGGMLFMAARGDGNQYRFRLYRSSDEGVTWDTDVTALTVMTTPASRYYPILSKNVIDGEKIFIVREPQDSDLLKNKAIYVIKTSNGLDWSSLKPDVTRNIVSGGAWTRSELQTVGNKFLVAGSAITGDQTELLGWCYSPLGKMHLIVWINHISGTPTNEVRLYNYNGTDWVYQVMPFTATSSQQFKLTVAKEENLFDIFTVESIGGFNVVRKYEYNLVSNTKDAGVTISPLDNNASLLRITENIDATKPVILSGNIDDGVDFNNMWIYPYIPNPE